MPKSEKQPIPLEVVATTEVRTDKGVLVNAPDNGFSVERTPTEGKLTFSMYCTARNIPVQHVAGMRAFTKTNEATLSEWDAIFKRY